MGAPGLPAAGHQTTPALVCVRPRCEPHPANASAPPCSYVYKQVVHVLDNSFSDLARCAHRLEPRPACWACCAVPGVPLPCLCARLGVASPPASTAAARYPAPGSVITCVARCSSVPRCTARPCRQPRVHALRTHAHPPHPPFLCCSVYNQRIRDQPHLYGLVQRRLAEFKVEVSPRDSQAAKAEAETKGSGKRRHRKGRPPSPT